MITNAINLLFENNSIKPDFLNESMSDLQATLESTIGNINMDNSMSNTEFLIKFSAETAYNECVLIESTNYLLEDGEQKEKSGKLDKIKKILSNFWAGVKAFIAKIIKGIKEQSARFISFIKRAVLFNRGNNIIGKIEKIVKKSKQNEEIIDFLDDDDYNSSNIISYNGFTKRIKNFSLNCKLDDVLNKYYSYVSSPKYFEKNNAKEKLYFKDNIVEDIVEILEINKLCDHFNDDNRHYEEKDEVKRYCKQLSEFSVKILEDRKISIDDAMSYLSDANTVFNFMEKEGLKYFNSYIKQLERWLKILDNAEKEANGNDSVLNDYNLDNLKIFREALTSSISICNCYTKYIIKVSAGIISENKRFIVYAKAKLNKVKEMYKKSGKSQETKEVEKVIEDINDIAEETSKEN